MPQSVLLRSLFFAEGALTVFGGIVFIFNPVGLLDQTIRSLTTSASTHPVHPASSTQLVQYLGALTITLGMSLLFAAKDTKEAAMSRRIVYWTLLVGEVALVGVLLWQAASGDSTGLSAATGIKMKALLTGAGILAAFGSARAYILLAKSEWFNEAEITERKLQ